MEKDDLKELDNLCKSTGLLLNWLAVNISKMPFEPRTDNIVIISEALGKVSEISTQVWEERPELNPHNIQAAIKNKSSVVYDANNPLPKELKNKVNMIDAIEFLEGLLSVKNIYLQEIAEKEIKNLTNKLNET